LDELPERCPSLNQRGFAEVLPIEMKEIERKQHQPMSGLMDRRTQGIEIGDAIFILDDELAIDQGRLAGELGSSIDDALVGSGPVSAMAREGPHSALVDDDQRAIAIMLDLVNPALSGGRLRDEGRDFRRNEAKRGHRRLCLAGAAALRKVSKKAPKALN
jgi:hypothetical protein